MAGSCKGACLTLLLSEYLLSESAWVVTWIKYFDKLPRQLSDASLDNAGFLRRREDQDWAVCTAHWTLHMYQEANLKSRRFSFECGRDCLVCFSLGLLSNYEGLRVWTGRSKWKPPRAIHPPSCQSQPHTHHGNRHSQRNSAQSKLSWLTRHG